MKRLILIHAFYFFNLHPIQSSSGIVRNPVKVGLLLLTSRSSSPVVVIELVVVRRGSYKNSAHGLLLTMYALGGNDLASDIITKVRQLLVENYFQFPLSPGLSLGR